MVALSLCTVACSSGPAPITDAGFDAGANDAGSGDAGETDAGPPPIDAGYDAYTPFPPPPPPPCNPSAVFAGDPTMSLDVGSLDGSSAFAAYAQGAIVASQWGLQGGTMILPVIALDASVLDPSLCAQVELVNRTDPDFPASTGEVADFPGLTLNVMFVRRGGRLVSDAIQDQIGWSDPAGVRMILDVIVRGTDFAAQGSLHLEIGAAGAPPLCEPCPG